MIGVLALKITVDEIERGWGRNTHEILIADNNGIVFLSSRDDYRFRALAPISQAVRTNILETKQFPLQWISPMGLSTDVIRPSTVQVTLSSADNPNRFLAASTPLAFAGWHAIVFTPLTLVQQQVARTMALGGITLMALVFGVCLLYTSDAADD